jgi:hypothetical protein
VDGNVKSSRTSASKTEFEVGFGADADGTPHVAVECNLPVAGDIKLHFFKDKASETPLPRHSATAAQRPGGTDMAVCTQL